MTVVVASTVDSMFALAEDLLAAVVSAMTTTSGGAPDAAYITLGEPAWAEACAQAVVQAPTIGEETTNAGDVAPATARRYARGDVNLIGLVAYAMRCVTISELNSQIYQPPYPATLSAIGKQGYEDGWAVWNWVKRSARAGTLFNGPCSLVHLDGAAVQVPEGNLGGYRFTCRVELDGYDPTRQS